MTYNFYYLTGFDDEVIYVGKTKNSLNTRLSAHKTEAKFYNGEKHSLIEAHTPQLKIHELESIDCSLEESNRIEAYWIQQFMAWGFRICNTVHRLKSKAEKIKIETKAINIHKSLYDEFHSFCKEHRIIMAMAIRNAIETKLEEMKERELIRKTA